MCSFLLHCRCTACCFYTQVFPNIPAPGGENVGFSECARKHLAVKPRKGDAVLFHSIAPHGALEKKSLHTACPVIKVQHQTEKYGHIV
jgi:prolyl 4-hydroxylase